MSLFAVDKVILADALFSDMAFVEYFSLFSCMSFFLHCVILVFVGAGFQCLTGYNLPLFIAFYWRMPIFHSDGRLVRLLRRCLDALITFAKRLIDN